MKTTLTAAFVAILLTGAVNAQSYEVNKKSYYFIKCNGVVFGNQLSQQEAISGGRLTIDLKHRLYKWYNHLPTRIDYTTAPMDLCVLQERERK